MRGWKTTEPPVTDAGGRRTGFWVDPNHWSSSRWLAEDWADTFRGGKQAERDEAVERLLARPGDEPLQVLSAALEHYLPEVRIAAADGLGRLGCPEAVAPLLDALRREMGGHSGFGHYWFGLLYLLCRIVVGVLLAGLLLGCSLVLFWALKIFDLEVVGFGLKLWYHELIGYIQGRRSTARVLASIAGAIASIAEQSPDPSVRRILPDLEALSHDFLSNDRVIRSMNRAAAERIERVTRHLKSLPVAAGEPETQASLPIPVHTQQPGNG